MPATGLVHRGIGYADASDLARALVPVITAAVRAGETVAVALDAPTASMLRAALPVDAALAVEFLDPTRPSRHDAFQLAARRATIVAQAARAGIRTLLVTQDQPALVLPDDYWLRLESAFRVALADLPVTLLCAYRVARDRRRPASPAFTASHAETVQAGPRGFDDAVANPAHRDPVEVVGTLARAVVGTPPSTARSRRFGTAGLAALRRALAADVEGAGFTGEASEDVVYAVSEVATNAVEHGGGSGEVWTWIAGEAAEREFLCLVADTGRLVDPFPGVVPPPVDQDRGRGLWLARVLCDDVTVAVDDAGTRVRLARRLDRSEPTARQTR